jgi:hypothetical protein
MSRSSCRSPLDEAGNGSIRIEHPVVSRAQSTCCLVRQRMVGPFARAEMVMGSLQVQCAPVHVAVNVIDVLASDTVQVLLDRTQGICEQKSEVTVVDF